VDDGDDWLLVIWNNLLSLSGTGKLCASPGIEVAHRARTLKA